MDDKVHRFLDGDISREDLTAAELQGLEDMEKALGALKADRARLEDTDLAPRVMERILAMPSSGPVRQNVPDSTRSVARRVAAWLLKSREVSLTVRPAYALAVLILVAAGLQWDPLPEPDSDPTVFVRFEFAAPEAHSVQLVGSFSGWEPEVSLHRGTGGRWTALVPLPPGVHDYAFRVDGERWTVDPAAPRVADGFGGFNSRLSLLVARS